MSVDAASTDPAAPAPSPSAGTDSTAPATAGTGPCSAGHLIVRELEAHGVERIYCVPGESYLDVLDGLHDSPIRTIVCRQEGGAGYMAVAEGRLTGRPGIAMVTRGPGASNVMVAIHNAYQDATPLVVFVGLVPTEVRGREAFQEFDLAGWFGSTAKKVLTLDDPGSAARIVADAMHTAASGRPGPVIVGLPEDTQLVEVDGAVVPRARCPNPVRAPPTSRRSTQRSPQPGARSSSPGARCGTRTPRRRSPTGRPTAASGSSPTSGPTMASTTHTRTTSGRWGSGPHR